MKTKAVGALLVTLLVASSPAMAGYTCIAEAVDPAGRRQRITATVTDDYGAGATNLQRVIELGAQGSERYMGRFFAINYWGTMDSPWRATTIGFILPVYVKPPHRPLFAFFILDSGEHVERLVMDANGRDSFGRKAEANAYTPIPQILVTLDTRDTAFLGAFGKARQMAVELKYADGETLTRETFDVRRSEVMQRTMDSALRMHKEDTQKCEFIPKEAGVEL